MRIDQRRTRLSWRRNLAVAMFAAAVGTIGAKPFAPGMSYRISVTTSMPAMPGMNPGDMVIAGHGVSLASRSRVDLDTVQSAQPLPIGSGDYILMLDSGRVVAVFPTTKTYLDGFSMAMGSMPPEVMAQASLSNVSVTVEKLGAGDTIEGRPTDRYRMAAQYTLAIMGQSMTIANESEISAAQLTATVNTPFSGSLPKSMSTGPFAELYTKVVEAQKQVGGTPIKVTTTTSISGPMTMSLTQTMRITDIKPTDVDEKLFQIPDGYAPRPPTL
jgi:hypothetical protein